MELFQSGNEPNRFSQENTKLDTKSDIFKTFDEIINRTWNDEKYSSFSPAVNILENNLGYHLEVELPGLKIEDVNVLVDDDGLIIKGEKICTNPDVINQYRCLERSEGLFYRVIDIPTDVDKDKIKAELREGVLTIDIMKMKMTN